MFRLNSVFRTVLRAAGSAPSGLMAKGKFYYAVRNGFKPGVYKTWDECKSQVEKFPSAAYKKFASEKDAWVFVRGGAAAPDANAAAAAAQRSEVILPKRGPEPLEYIPLGRRRQKQEEEEEEEGASSSKRLRTSCPPSSSSSSSSSSVSSDGFTYMGDAVVVYTDGCCTGNGRGGARAGIGVYWGSNHPLNVADRLSGRQTNQRAELQAACRALEQARDRKLKKLLLYTDSKFTINGVTKWVKNWKQNGWRQTSGREVVTKQDFMKLDRLNSELDVVWMHIPGHAGYTGNEMADRLSREGAAKPYSPQPDEDLNMDDDLDLDDLDLDLDHLDQDLYSKEG